MLPHIWVVVIAVVGLVYSREITIVGDYWMPFCGDGVKESGCMVDIAREVFASESIAVVYRSLTWDKAVERTISGEFAGVIGASKNSLRPLQYPSVEQGLGRNQFIVRAGSTWQYTDTASLRGIKIGVTKEYLYNPSLDAYIAAHLGDTSRIVVGVGALALKDNLMKLKFGKVDAVVDDAAVLGYTLKTMKMTGMVKQGGAVFDETPLYIAFSSATSDGKILAELLSKGMERLRATGKLAEILERYGLKDWKK